MKAVVVFESMFGDTRLAVEAVAGLWPHGLPDSTARGVVRRLRRRGYRVVSRPQSFSVADTEGPLRSGEVDRARAWGERVGRAHLSAGFGQYSA